MWIGEAWECKPRCLHKYSDINLKLNLNPDLPGFFGFEEMEGVGSREWGEWEEGEEGGDGEMGRDYFLISHNF